MCWPHRVGVSVCHLAFITDFKIVDNGRLGRLDAYTGDLGRVRYKGTKFFNLTRPYNGGINMSFEEERNSLVISFAEGSIGEEEFLILYHEYESVNPLYPYREFEPFCLDSLDSSECKSEFRLENRKTGID